MARVATADRPARGYFGKVPGAADFVYHSLSAQVCEVWGDHMAGWVAAGSRVCGTEWPARFASSPVWRFILGDGIIGEAAWVGLLAGSIDSVGRAFPFTVLIAIDPALVGGETVAALDPHLDGLEAHMLAFMEGADAEDRLVAGLDDVVKHLTDGDLDPAAPGALGGLPRPRNGEDALLFIEQTAGPAGDAARSVHVLPGDGRSGATSAMATWWHHEPRDRRSESCVSRGVPAGINALPFFLGDWERHGWRPRDRMEGRTLP